MAFTYQSKCHAKVDKIISKAKIFSHRMSKHVSDDYKAINGCRIKVTSARNVAKLFSNSGTIHKLMKFHTLPIFFLFGYDRK